MDQFTQQAQELLAKHYRARGFYIGAKEIEAGNWNNTLEIAAIREALITARTIPEKEIMLRVREATAQWYEQEDCPNIARKMRSGKHDDCWSMQIAVLTLRNLAIPIDAKPSDSARLRKMAEQYPPGSDERELLERVAGEVGK